MKQKLFKILSVALIASVFTVSACTTDSSNQNGESGNQQDSGIASDDSTDVGGSDSTDGGGDITEGTISTSERKEDSDLNIYFTSTADAADSAWLWMWNDNDESFLFPAYPEQTAIPEISEDLLFTQVHLTFGQNYEAYAKWDATNETVMNIPDKDYLNYIIFRSSPDSSPIAQTKDMLINTDLMFPDANGNYNIYIDGTRNQIYYNAADFPVSTITSGEYGEALSPNGSVTAWVDLEGSNMENIFSEFNSSSIAIRKFTYNLSDGSRIYNGYVGVNYDSSIVNNDNSTRIYLSEPCSIDTLYEIQAKDPKTGELAYACDLSYIEYYSTPAFDRQYYTDEQMGAFVHLNEDGEEVTTFRMWSPTAQAASVYVYDNPDDSQPAMDLYFPKGDKGVFEATVEGNLHGKYYTFNVNNYGTMYRNVPDPYALSSNANGTKSMVVDWNKVEKPENYNRFTEEGWTPSYDNYAGVTIMEMHTRDFTSSASWNGPKEDVGKFKGLYDSGTKLEDGTATGFDYVKELKEAGLTHVQIMPAFDFASVDETKLDDPEYQTAAKSGIYNWGYDPQQYNAPEGSYSSDPNDGNTRVEEFMDFVDAYNSAGVGVIMDVVYNHMPGQSGTSFDRVFPGYYFRSGTVSGAGVDVASQRSMVRQFIVDSVVGWAEHYHISGFRFDLMGILDIQTMKQVRQALDEIDPSILVYGEGWQMFQDNTDPSSGLGALDMTYQGTLSYMGEDWVGSFNDDVRDGIKGQQSGDWSIGDQGYAQKAILGTDNFSGTKEKVYFGLTGTMYYDGYGNNRYRFTYAPEATDGIGASIMYTECHDNLTLWDKLSMSTPLDQRDMVPTMAKLANSTVLSSLSPSFFEIGQDFGRSKAFTDEKFKTEGEYFEDPELDNTYYSHNSYNLSDEINQVDWSLLGKETGADMEQAFRKSLSERKQASTVLAEMFADNGGNPNAAFMKSSSFTADYLSNDYVLCYKLTRNNKTYEVIINYSTADYSLGNGTVVPSRSSAIVTY